MAGVGDRGPKNYQSIKIVMCASSSGRISISSETHGEIRLSDNNNRNAFNFLGFHNEE